MNKYDEYNEFNSWAKITWTKTDTWRNGYKWSVNECLQLEREFDLLQLSVPEIAKLHNRTVSAIIFKLQAEGLDTYNNLYIKTYGEDYLGQEINNFICQETDDDPDDDDDQDDD